MLLNDISSPKSCQRTWRDSNSKTAIHVPNPPTYVSYFQFMRHFWNWLSVSYGGTLRSFYRIFLAEFYQFSGIPSTVLPLHAHTHTSPHDSYVDCTDTPKICYLPLSRQVAVTEWQIPDAIDTVVCAPDDGWRYHPKRVEQFPDINKLCNVASCWIYIGICKVCILINSKLWQNHKENMLNINDTRNSLTSRNIFWFGTLFWVSRNYR
jgi:hypothetical protein